MILYLCNKCFKHKPSTDFYKNAKAKYGFSRTCKNCDNIRRNQHIKDNPRIYEKHSLKSQLKHRFNITPEVYYNLLTKQNSLCAICNKPETRPFNNKIRRLAIDHCHITGTIRGLLCANCNTAIGLFKDDKALLLAAIEYLAKK